MSESESVNPQSFRRQLEAAIERRDSAALAELEQRAPENPTTAEIWRLHQQLEGAIDRWRDAVTATPRPESAAPARRGRASRWIRVTLAASCLFLVYRSLVPDVDLWDASNTSQQLAATDESSWLDRWQGSLTSSDPDNQLPPELPLTTAPSDSNGSSELIAAGALTDTGMTPGSTAANALASTPLVTYSLALADRSQLLLPPGLLPALPNVSLQLEQGIHATWDTLSSWPQEMQDAWRTFQTPAEGEPQWTPESEQEEHTPSLRRFRGRRTFSWGTSAGADRFLA